MAPRWWLNSAGYLEGRMADGRRVKAHRWVLEQALGRRLRPAEIVHHRNGNRTDNRLANLELMTRSRHAAHHLPENVRFVSATGCADHLVAHNRQHGPWNRGLVEEWTVQCEVCRKPFQRSAAEVRKGLRRGYRVVCSIQCRCELARLAKARGEER